MDTEELTRLYTHAGSIRALARLLGTNYSAARSRLVAAGIPLLSDGYRSPKKVRHYGTEHHNWKGGMYRHSDGYIYEYAPDHPDAPKGKGYVLQHRLIVERSLCRYLLPTEIVHHRNEDKQDNRLENLEVVTRSRHMKHHKSASTRDEHGRFSS